MEKHEEIYSVISRDSDGKVLQKGYSLDATNSNTPAGYTKHDIPAVLDGDSTKLQVRGDLDAVELSNADRVITSTNPADQVYDSVNQVIT